MKILLIDNHSKHRDELIDLLGNCATVETQEELFGSDTNAYDLVVLSGGSNTPSVLYSPEAYSKEMSLVLDTDTPVLGICLGSEIITKAFGGTLVDLGTVHRGDVSITIVDEGLKDRAAQSTMQVFEAHKVGVKDLPDGFVVCAYSDHGPEILRHRTRPVMGIQFHPEVRPNRELIGWVLDSLV